MRNFLLLLHIGYWFNCGLNLHLIFLYSNILAENSSFSENILICSNSSDTLLLEPSSGISVAGLSFCTTFMTGFTLYILDIQLSALSTYSSVQRVIFGNRKPRCLSHHDSWYHFRRKVFHFTFQTHFWIKWALRSVLSGNSLHKVHTLHRFCKLEL